MADGSTNPGAIARPAPPPSRLLPVAAAVPPPAPATTAAPASEAEQLAAPPSWRNVLRTSSSFAVSMVVHAVALVALSLVILPTVVREQLVPLEVSELPPQEEWQQLLDESVAPAETVSFESSSAAVASVGLPTGHSAALEGGGAAPAYDRQVSESLEGPPPGLGDFSPIAVGGESLALDAPEGAPGDPAAVVDTYAEALDRITQEILMFLLKGDVTVLWLFDQSESMKDDQQEIRDRFERVYTELGLTEAAQGGALLTSIGSFGERFMLHTTRPTDRIEEIREAIDAVPSDPSGLEMLCPAIGQMINHHRRVVGRRQLMLVVLTDERGEYDDSIANLESAIAEAKSARCPVYFLSREAVFGYLYAHMRWVHPQTGGVHWLPVDRGPETAFVEQLQTEGFHRRYDAHPSGFGPYEQTRIALETGGIFFMLPSPEIDLVERDDRKYALAALRPYLPDLGPRDQYLASRDASLLRSTLWKVINDLNPYDPQKTKIIELRMQFSADPAAFAAEAREELDKAAIYVTYLDAAEKALAEQRRTRDGDPLPRWRANYDLLYAQVMAYKVRIYEYGAYLTEFLKQPKPVPLRMPPNLTLGRWDVAHRSQTTTGELTAETIEKSAKLFQQIVAEHAGTPWAARAEWELARGFGIELQEIYYPPPSPPGPGVRVTIPIPKL
jgi:hypothetical protein